MIGEDYALQTITVPVARYSPQSLSFDIYLSNDDLVECFEMFNVLISPTSWCGVVSGNTARVTIINDDSKGIMYCILPCCVRAINVQWRIYWLRIADLQL